MGRVLPQNIQLTFEVLGVERTAPAGATLAVVRAEDDERLENRRLLARSSGTKDSTVRGYFSPSEHAETQIPGELREHSLLPLEANRVVLLEEYVTDGVLAWLGQLASDLPLSLTLEE